MAEGSQADPAPATEVQEPSPAGDATETRSPEEIEAIWKNRVSQKDRAHAAEAKALRERAEAAEAKAARTAEAEAEGSSDADQWKAKYEASQKAVEQERTERLIEVREAKYPMAAEALEPEVLAKMDEGKLAALNARLDDGEPAPSGRIDPNAAPRRTPSPPTSPRDKSVAELEADLKRYGPGYVNQIHGE